MTKDAKEAESDERSRSKRLKKEREIAAGKNGERGTRRDTRKRED